MYGYGLHMRIAHVSDCYAPRTGGIETQVRALAMAQRDQGNDVCVITATPGHDAVRAGLDLVDGIEVYRVAARLPFELPVHPRTRAHVVNVLTAHPVDVVHVHAGVISPFAWGAIRAARQLGLPTLVTVHSVWGPLATPGFKLANALTRWNNVAVSSVSARAAESVEAALGRPVLVTPNGIDVDAWRVAPASAERNTIRLVSVMRLAPRKRLTPLLRMITQAKAELDGEVQVHATIIGDGPELAKAYSFIARHGLGNTVVMPGRLSPGEIREVFAHSDVFVQPSIKESFGLAALEARSAGLPVIVQAESGSTEFVEDRVSGLVANGDLAMVSAIVDLARDVQLRERIAAHNRDVPPVQSWDGVLAAVEHGYAVAGAT